MSYIDVFYDALEKEKPITPESQRYQYLVRMLNNGDILRVFRQRNEFPPIVEIRTVSHFDNFLKSCGFIY